MMSGVCVDCANEAGGPSVDAVAAAGADGIRQVAFDTPNFYRYCDEFRVSGFKVAVVLARESFPDENYGAWAEHYALRMTPPNYWLIGNEQDSWMIDIESPSSWSLRPGPYATLFKECAEAILAVQPDAQLVLGGFVAGQPSILPVYLDEIRAIYDGPIGGADVHPYGRSASSARDLLREYGAILDAYGI